jgi:hypothetical protein
MITRTKQRLRLLIKGVNSTMSYQIKPGPKPKKEDGSDDRRRHVDPPNKPKHPSLPLHDPKKK